jgi:hypothetical protein
LAIVLASGLWLIGVGALMALRPRVFLRLLSLTASSWRVNAAEQVPRLIAGSALVVHAEASKLPALFAAGGWFIAMSSLVLLAVPLRWHSGYAKWWAVRLSPAAVRAIAPFSAAGGAGLIYAAW